MQAVIGKVTTASRGRLHLGIAGRARCNSGRAILATTAHGYRPIDATRVCGHCRRHLAAAIATAQADVVVTESPCYSEREVRRLTAAVESLDTPAERAELAALATDIADHLGICDTEALYRSACDAAIPATVLDLPTTHSDEQLVLAA